LREAHALNPDLQVMASPWSAPAWMKTPRTRYGGALNDAHYAVYAQYLVRFVQAYQAEGIPIHALTVQNEPRHTDPRYPTMRMAYPEQARSIRDYLGPAIEQAGLDTRILIWDHNWDGADYALGVLADEGARRYVAGTAWHCYAGRPEAQSVVQQAYPEVDVYFTECSGGGWDTDFESVLGWNVEHLLIGAVRHGAKTVLLWNLALDEGHGPHLGGCNDCRGVVTVRRNGAVDLNVEYYLLGHLAKFVPPGAYRIGSETYHSSVESVAFRNPDGSIVLVAYNPELRASPEIQVVWRDRAFSYTLPRRSVATFVIEGE
jgi:glucosylceramidase